MAWPYSPHTNFVAVTTRIAAAFLNSVEEHINHVFNGTYRLKKIEVNNAGGASTTAGAGEIVAAGLIESSTQVNGPKLYAFGNRSSATPGAGQSVAAGIIYGDTACFAWGKVTVNVGGGVCALVRGVNVASVTKTGTGVYTVVLQTPATNILAIQVTGLDSQASIFLIDKATPPTTTTFRVLCFDATGIATDTNGNDGGFYFEVKQG